MTSTNARVLVLSVVYLLLLPIAAVSFGLSGVATADPAGSATPSSGATGSGNSSTTFDRWTSATADSPTSFDADRDSHHGQWSLRISRPSTETSSAPATLSQMIAVEPGKTLDVSFYARAQDAADGAVRLEVNGDPASAVSLPSGTYGWKLLRCRFPVSWVRPKLGSLKVQLQIVSAAPTASTQIDHLTVISGGQSVLANGGFEQNSAGLTLTNSSLVFPSSSVGLHVASALGASTAFRWTLTRDDGLHVASGAGVTTAGGAALEIRPPAGYYRFAMSWSLAGRRVTRTTNLVVMPPRQPSHSQFTSVGLHLGQATLAGFKSQLHDLAAIGVRNLRTDVSWAAIEQIPGQYVFPQYLDDRVKAATAAGIGSLLIVDYSNPLYDGGRTPSSPAGIAAYARFAAAVARHYPRASIDVYNEFNFVFNTGACGTTPHCYMALLRPTSDAIRTASKGTTISAPSISGDGTRGDWLDTFIAEGGLRYSNAVSIHPYQHNSPPDVLESRFAALNRAIAAAGSHNPIWLTEFGYTTAIGQVSEATQANYLLRMTVIAKESKVRRFYWYDAFDDSVATADRESCFGLFRQPTSFAPSAWVPKPAAAADGVASRFLAGRSFKAAETIAPSVRSYSFTGKRPLRVMWSLNGTVLVPVQSSVQVHSATGAQVNTVLRGGKTFVRVGASPLYVEG